MVLFLNDVAGSEIILILFFVLMFFGSKSIPGLARSLGRTIRQVKDATAEMQAEIRKSGGEMKKDLNLEGLMRETEETIQRPLDQYADDLDNAVKYRAPSKSHLSEAKAMPESPKIAEIPEKAETPSEKFNDKTEETDLKS